MSKQIIGLGSENPAEVAMVIDISGSMAGTESKNATKLDLAKSACVKFIGVMRLQKDSLGVCSFSTNGEFEWGANNNVQLLADVGTRTSAIRSVLGLTTQGNTNMYAGLNLAGNMFSSFGASNKALILLSDGHDNEPGDEEAKATELNAADKFIYTVAIGSGSDKAKLERMAGKKSRYNYIGNAFNAQKVFNEIINEIGIANLLLNKITSLGSAEISKTVASQADNTVPEGKTSIVMAIAWDRLQYTCAGVNTNALLKENQVAFNVGTFNSNGILEFTDVANITIVSEDKGIVVLLIKNAKAGEHYGCAMQKYYISSDAIRFSVGVFA